MVTTTVALPGKLKFTGKKYFSSDVLLQLDLVLDFHVANIIADFDNFPVLTNEDQFDVVMFFNPLVPGVH